MAIDMSPEAIERRLRQVSEARKLGLSLRRAGNQIRDDVRPDDRDGTSGRHDDDVQRDDRAVRR